MFNFKKEYEGLGFNDNISGLQTDVLLADKKTIANLAPLDAYPNSPSFTGSAADLLGTVKISGDHTFLLNQGFIKFYSTIDTSSLEVPMQNKKDQQGGMIKLKFFHPGSMQEVEAFASHANKTEWVVLVKNVEASPTDPYIQLGGVYGLYASIGRGYKTNNLTGDKKGYEIEIEAFMPRLIWYYGNVALKA